MIGSFKHRFADAAEVVMRHDRGGFVSDLLIITANIPLTGGKAGFDQDKVNELINAAVQYSAAGGHPYTSIGFKENA